MTGKITSRSAFIAALLSCRDQRAAEQLTRRNRRWADEPTSRALGRRFNRDLRVDRGRAERALSPLRALARVQPSPFTRAESQRIAGVLDHVSGRPAAASRRLRSAAALFERDHRWIEAGDVHRVLVDVLMYPGHDDEARESGRAAKRCYTRAGGVDRRRRGSLEMNLGNLHHRRDRLDQALAAYARARRHFELAGEPLRLASVDFNRANVLVTLDRTASARELYLRARRVFAKAGRRAVVAQTDAALAAVDLLEGRLDDALERLVQLRDHHEAQGDSLGAAHCDLDAGEACLRLNRPRDAVKLARRAERMFRRFGHDAEMAACAGLLGGAALQSKRPGLAVRQFGRGRDLQLRLGNAVAASMHGIGLAQALLQSGRHIDARSAALSAARTLRRFNVASREARALTVAARAALASNRSTAARRWADRALALARKGRDLRVELAALLVLAAVETGRGRSAAAYRRLRSAERCVERLRRGVSTEESRLAFALDKSEVYEALVLNRLARGDRRSVEQALVFAERGKSRALAEQLGRGRLGDLASGPRSADALQRLDEMERQLALAESRLEQPGATPGIRKTQAIRLKLLTSRRVKLLAGLARQDPERASLAGALIGDPLAAVRTLGRDEIVLEYTEAGGHYHLFLLDRDGVTAFPELAPVDRVRDLVEPLRFQLGKGVLGEAHTAQFAGFIGAALRAYLTGLHELLLAPVADRLEGRAVRIIPHGLLHGLPFHALERDGVALMERCVVSYAPSLTVMSLLARRRRVPNSAPVVLGVADRTAPLIEDEVQEVRRHLSGAVVCRGEGNIAEALRQAQRRPSLLHVACHGFFDGQDGGAAGLRLGDLWLSLPDVYALRTTASLVVLSGCETGRGTVYSGDEWVGLVRGFLQAGASAVVASLWEVHDRSTLELMSDFYRGLAEGLTVAEALTTAQRAARRRNSLTLRWAPFMVLGDPGLRLSLRKAA